MELIYKQVSMNDVVFIDNYRDYIDFINNNNELNSVSEIPSIVTNLNLSCNNISKLIPLNQYSNLKKHTRNDSYYELHA
jgi:hypothetical protein